MADVRKGLSGHKLRLLLRFLLLVVTDEVDSVGGIAEMGNCLERRSAYFCWSKYVIGFLIVFKFQIEVANDFVGCLHLFVVSFDFPVHFGVQIEELFDLMDVFHSAGPFFEQLLQLIILLLQDAVLLLMLFSHDAELLVEQLRMLQPLLFDGADFGFALTHHIFYLFCAIAVQHLLHPLQLLLFGLDPLLDGHLHLFDFSLFTTHQEIEFTDEFVLLLCFLLLLCGCGQDVADLLLVAEGLQFAIVAAPQDPIVQEGAFVLQTFGYPDEIMLVGDR